MNLRVLDVVLMALAMTLSGCVPKRMVVEIEEDTPTKYMPLGHCAGFLSEGEKSLSGRFRLEVLVRSWSNADTIPEADLRLILTPGNHELAYTDVVNRIREDGYFLIPRGLSMTVDNKAVFYWRGYSPDHPNACR